MQAVLQRFPGAEIVDVRKAAAVIAEESVPAAGREDAVEAGDDEFALAAQSLAASRPEQDDA